ncbi:hypothetical protein [Spiroplasma cantharicola]|uniref:Uncharacterized protein n=1 Tax=Spiroplasma cantharicola TaxID=362837 RepID=A0A0M3SJ35_9MOLU|nr:hypothetical protein [Spiroplasma cantharicola]ALD66054.1 hypothetical protein SCANT_v1c01440 [Spiroplasma cantharicola]
MSMSAEEILINCEKQFSFIKKDIDVLIEYIIELISQCEQIDNSGFYKKEIEKLLEQLKREKTDLAKNTYERELSSDTHIAIETYHEIQRFAERKRETIAEFKTQVYSFKKDVLIKEQENILKAFNKDIFKDLNSLKNELIAKYKNDQDKIYIKKMFETNQHKLINKTSDQIYSLIMEDLKELKASNQVIAKEIIGDSIQLYKEDLDVIKAIKDSANKLSLLKESKNFQKDIKQYFLSSSKLAEQEAIRKDNVIKIVKAIREVGYIVKEENIRKLEEKNMILIHGEKLTGETADFVVKLDGSFVYNWEGFEGREHDSDAQAFIKKLKEFNLHSSDEFNKQYREPKYIAKNRQNINSKKNKNSSK